ncbi:hypothetical protein P3W53_26105 [Pseudomonas denitrificans (nom. rej.)]|nr:hypothetical protein [Pseudomonas denitrificans (nom. rej.)]
MDVDGDVKKARGFLMTFSTVVMLGWYFAVDLTSFSIWGSAIKLTANIHNLWLVIAVANVYFLLRYIQQLPPDSIAPDDEMEKTYEQILIWFSNKFYRKKLFEYAASGIGEEDQKAGCKVVDIYPRAHMSYRAEFEENEKRGSILTLAHVKRQHKNKITYYIPFSYEGPVSRGTQSGSMHELTPGRFVALASRVIGFIKGSLFTPWMSEYIVPVVFGLFSIGTAAFSWARVNFM